MRRRRLSDPVNPNRPPCVYSRLKPHSRIFALICGPNRHFQPKSFSRPARQACQRPTRVPEPGRIRRQRNSVAVASAVGALEVNLETAIDQLERYKLLMDNYVEQNCSITVSYDPSEVDAIVSGSCNIGTTTSACRSCCAPIR